MNRIQRPPLAEYEAVIREKLPVAKIRLAHGTQARAPFDAVLTWTAPDGRVMRYLVEEKRHLRHQDIAVIAEQVNRHKAALPQANAHDRALVLAPHVRPEQAAVLERAGIDYLDLAGNAHLNVPGLFVHVAGQRPPKAQTTAVPPAQRGWVKTVMALLIRPELPDTPYRDVAEQAGVALGTVAKCMKDLERRGFLVDDKNGRHVGDRQALTALWVQAYIDGHRPKLEERRFQVLAADKAEIWTRLQTVMKERVHPWALTGADAAARRTQFLRAAETEVYAPIHAFEDRDMQRALIAQPTAGGGNMLIIEPPGPLAIPAQTPGALPLAPVLLAYAELRYRGTEQALEAAELLLPMVLGDAAH
ncbi:MAG: type IV toxin-antitoxin system AbiEi family antitoxin [Vicinamibacterales bacterium]